MPSHGRDGRRTRVREARRVGVAVVLASVLLLFATGTYTALLHAGSPQRFVASAYGAALGVKLLMVLVIVAIAALNRLWWLPAFLRAGPVGRFRVAMRVEAALLVVIFLVTGWLTTSSVPHEPGVQTTALENLAAFVRFVTGRSP